MNGIIEQEAASGTELSSSKSEVMSNGSSNQIQVEGEAEVELEFQINVIQFSYHSNCAKFHDRCLLIYLATRPTSS